TLRARVNPIRVKAGRHPETMPRPPVLHHGRHKHGMATTRQLGYSAGGTNGLAREPPFHLLSRPPVVVNLAPGRRGLQFRRRRIMESNAASDAPAVELLFQKAMENGKL